MIVNVLTDGTTTVEIIQDNLPNVVEVFESPAPNVVEVITAGPQGPQGPPGTGGGSLTGGIDGYIPLWSGSAALTSSIVNQISGSLQISGYTSITGSLTQGVFSIASGQSSHAEGVSTIASEYGSHAEGDSTTASGNISHAEGIGTIASGYGSHAEGEGTIASGESSHAEGVDTIATGTFSHAEGDTTLASGYASHAEGIGTVASGQSSHAEGEGTIASGESSHAEGSNAVATGNYQHVQGQYNITSSVAGAFIHGNGTSNSSRSNLIYAYDSTVEITGSLKVSGSITGSLFGTASYAKNASTSSNILGGKATHIPYFITDTTLATSSLFQSGSTSVIINQDNNTTANPEALYVWQPSTTSFNVISGKGNLNNYLQLNISNTNQGTNASSDIVATANNGDETINYIDMGINSQNYSGVVGGPNDAYLYSTGQHLHIGNTTPNMPVQFFVGGNNTDTNRKFELNANGQHNITGSLQISGGLKVNQGITGSLLGNASTATNATNATSSSYALVADSTPYATIAGNGGVTNIIAGSGITLPFGGSGAVTIVASGGGGVTIISGSAVTSSFINSSTWTFSHNLGTRTPTITVFDSNYNQIIPQNILLVDTGSATITFPTLESGFAIASTGGTTGTALSSSYSLFSTYAASASYFPETDPVFVAKSASLATTGSNVFKGNQTVTGSLTITGSNTLIGTKTITGSLLVSGSTLQTGNNTLIGNTTLSGSINVSGSQTFRGNLDLTGSLTILGSTTQIGNNTLVGNTILTGSVTISGSTFFNGNIIPVASSSFDLGSETNPWRSLYLQSSSLSIQSDIPGNPNAVISNQTGNITINSAGFQIKSGSSIPFLIDTSGRTKIFTPSLPANDQGAFSIVGSSDGSAQTIGLAGRMVHITGNDNLPSRIENDSFGVATFPAYIGRNARGIASSPSASQTGDILSRLAALGYGNTGYLATDINSGPPINSIDFVAKQNYNDASASSAIEFYTSPQNARVRTLSATVDSTGITVPSSSRLFGTASWALNAQTSSYVIQAVSASYASTASYVPNYVLNSSTGSFATTGSNIFIGNQTITGSLRISGSLTEIGNTTITGSLLITGSTTHNGDISVSGSVLISGSIIMDGTAQSLVIKTSATNPSALAIHTFSTASYSGANYNFVVIEDSTNKSTTYNILVAQGNNKVAEIKTYLIKSEGSSPVPTIATAINAGKVELRMTDTGTFTYRGIVQLF